VNRCAQPSDAFSDDCRLVSAKLKRPSESATVRRKASVPLIVVRGLAALVMPI
jgi:hypothetical protein